MAVESTPNLFPSIITGSPSPAAAGRRAASPSRAEPPPRRGAQPPPLPGRRGVPIVVAHGEGEPLPWTVRTKQWVWGFGGESLGVSLAVHAVLLLILAFIITAQPREEEIVTTVSSDNADVVEFEPLDVDFDMIPEEEVQVQNPLLEPAPAAPSDVLADTTIGQIIGSGQGLLGEQGGGGKLNLPRKFFSKGSFTVWTDPQDPTPSEDYHIVIQVDVREARHQGDKYPKHDISGSVEGTDNYRQKFGGRQSLGYLDVTDGHVQFRVLVPGAARLVRDTIEVRSEMLKEEQTIEIVF
jgi:hypothetical protein